MLQTLRYIREFRSGSSLPILVEASDSAQYVCKLKGAGEGVLALIVEFIALRIVESWNIPTVHPIAIELHKAIIPQTIDPEIIELMERSVGINLATEYLDQSNFPSTIDLNITAQTKQRILLMDILLLNADRSIHNMNVLQSTTGLRWIDFGSAVAIRELITGNKVSLDLLLPSLVLHPFIDELPNIDRNKIPCITRADVQRIISGIPQSWFRELQLSRTGIRSSEQLLESLHTLCATGTTIVQRLDALLAYTPETELERKLRQQRNRQLFDLRLREN